MAKNTIRDGWHTICGYEVYVEDGYIMHGVTGGWQSVTTWPYRACKHGGWDATGPITVDAFRAGVRRGTIMMS